MATAEYSATIQATGTARAGSSNLIGACSPSSATLPAAVAAAIATLVADGASPTQAHVTTLNNAWTPFAAALDAVTADVSVLIGSTTNVNTKSKLKAALDAIYRCAAGGSNLLTD